MWGGAPGLWWVPGSGPEGWVFGLLRFTSEHPPLRPRPLPSVVGPTPVEVQEKNKDHEHQLRHDVAELLVLKTFTLTGRRPPNPAGGGGPEGPVLWT